MNWVMAVLAIAALFALARIVFLLRRARRQGKEEDWDARMVKNLRSAGANAFTPYEVDFFFSVPDEATCSTLKQRLEPDGFKTDSRPMHGDLTGFSVHASKRLRLSVAEIQGYSQRFRELADQLGGTYDGWTTDPSRV